MHTALTLCDLSKAFDCVSHEILLEKLHYYGIRGVPLSLFTSYLTNRKQCVSINNSTSSFQNVKHGVPQGSVLGPLLFIIYINDICNYLLPNKCILFADDTTLICSGKNFDDLEASSNLIEKKAQEWFTSNKLMLNEGKSQKLFLSSNNNLVNGSSVNLLGIRFDDKLNWSCHVNMLRHKLCSIIFLLRQLKDIIHINTLKSTYFSLFHSQLTYGILLWGNSDFALQIFRQQKKAIRIIANAGYRDHCQPLFIGLGIMSLPSLYIYTVLLEIHKNISVYSTQSDVHNYNTRNANNLRTACFRLTKSQKNSLNLNLYNILPTHIKNLNVYQFKKQLKRHMLQHCFYTTEDYLLHSHVF